MVTVTLNMRTVMVNMVTVMLNMVMVMMISWGELAISQLSSFR